MPTLNDLAHAEPQRRMTTLEKLGQTWPARMGKSVLSALALPGDVWAGRTQPGTDDYYDRASELAGLAMSGGTLGGVQGAGAVLGSGPVRKAALPMDEASRMARAKEMGFDVDVPLYHGTGSEIAAFDMKKARDKEGRRRGLGLGAGKIYLHPSPEVASKWAEEAPRRKLGSSPNVMPSYARGKFMDESAYHAEFRKHSGGEEIFSSNLSQSQRDAAIAKTDAAVKAQGYGGIRQVYRNADGSVAEVGQVAVFEPKNIRSRFAAFDPAKSDSANLLASGGNPIMGGAMATQGQNDDLGSILNRALTGTP